MNKGLADFSLAQAFTPAYSKTVIFPSPLQGAFLYTNTEPYGWP